MRRYGPGDFSEHQMELTERTTMNFARKIREVASMDNF